MTRRAGALALALLTPACGYWGRRPLDQEPAPLKPKTPVWIWSQGTVSKWHDVVITQDTVAGIPFGSPENCYAACWRSIGRAQVDSMNVGYRTGTQDVAMYTGILILALAVEFEVCSLFHIQNCG